MSEKVLDELAEWIDPRVIADAILQELESQEASRTPRPFPEQEVQLLTALGHQLGIAIENAQLYQELQLREEMRAELLRQIITAQEDERRF